MLLEPSLHARFLVRPVVVHDQMQGHLLGKLGVQPAASKRLFTWSVPCKPASGWVRLGR
jgi:hypothetical protein